MKKLLILFLSTLVLVHFAYAEVGHDDLNKIRKLIAENKYPEALAAHQKFFEESKYSSGMHAVRLSFGLASWAELGKKYLPAYEALAKIAADHKTSIYSGKGNFNIFSEYNSINSYIGKKKETLVTFLFVDKNYPEQADSFYIVIDSLLVEEEQYDLIKKYAEDPIYAYESLRNERERGLSKLRKKSPSYSIEKINTEYLNKVNKLIEVTEKIEMQEEVREIKRRHESYFSGNLLRKYH